MAAGDLATTRNAPPGRIVLVGKVKSRSPESRYPLMSSEKGLELNSSTYSSSLPSARGAGLYMISEMTRPVLRLDGPSGSRGEIRYPTIPLVTKDKSRNLAEVVKLVVWLLVAGPK